MRGGLDGLERLCGGRRVGTCQACAMLPLPHNVFPCLCLDHFRRAGALLPLLLFLEQVHPRDSSCGCYRGARQARCSTRRALQHGGAWGDLCTAAMTDARQLAVGGLAICLALALACVGAAAVRAWVKETSNDHKKQHTAECDGPEPAARRRRRKTFILHVQMKCDTAARCTRAGPHARAGSANRPSSGACCVGLGHWQSLGCAPPRQPRKATCDLSAGASQQPWLALAKARPMR